MIFPFCEQSDNEFNEKSTTIAPSNAYALFPEDINVIQNRKSTVIYLISVRIINDLEKLKCHIK